MVREVWDSLYSSKGDKEPLAGQKGLIDEQQNRDRKKERESTSQQLGVNVKNTFPPPTVGQYLADMLADRLLTGYQQVSDK